MKITAYPLYDHVAPLRPASKKRAWLKEHAALAADLALSTANGTGWVLLCPHAFEATWNGGSDPEDIAIRLDATDGDAPPFVQSQLGGGLLTFYRQHRRSPQARCLRAHGGHPRNQARYCPGLR